MRRGPPTPPATASGSVSFNLLHAKCGSRIKQQTFCPVCNVVVDRAELVRGYEFAKDQYVRVTDEELKGLEGEASKVIDIAEFVPLEKVDPIYFERTYYLGPDKGGEKAYRLLADAMAKSGRVALAKFVMRGKESLVLLRSAQDGLMQALKETLNKRVPPAAQRETIRKPPSKVITRAEPVRAAAKKAQGGKK